MSPTRDKYYRAVAGLSAVVEGVPADGWSACTPCSGWTARELVSHLIGGFEAISAVDGGPAPGPEGEAGTAADAALAYAGARDRALAALTDENLAMLVPGPAGDITLEQKVAMFCTPDVLLHTWDLAKAAGIEVALDSELVHETYEALLPLDAMLRSEAVFGPKVDPPPGADEQARLLCFTGRRP
jgi:uncharacterized protein (TIGR03086 family)